MSSEAEIIENLDRLVKVGAYIELAFALLEKNILLIYTKHLAKNVEMYAKRDLLVTLITALGINKQLGFLPYPVLEALAKRYPDTILEISYLPDVVYLSAYTSKKELSEKEQERAMKLIEEEPVLSKPFLIPLFIRNPKIAEKMIPYGSFITAAALYALGSVYDKKTFFRILDNMEKLKLVDVSRIKSALKSGLPIEDALEEGSIDILTMFSDTFHRFSIDSDAVSLPPRAFKILELNKDSFKMDTHFSPTANIISVAFRDNKEVRDNVFVSLSVFLRSQRPSIRKTALESIILLYKGTGEEKPLPTLIPYIKDPNEEIRKLVATGLALIYKNTPKDMFVFNKIVENINIKDLKMASTIATAIKNLFVTSPNKAHVVKLLNHRIKTEENVYKVSMYLLSLGQLREGERDEQTRKFLLSYLEQENIQLKCAAIGALGMVYAKTGDMKLFEILRETINTSNKDVILFTAEAIGNIFRGTKRDVIILKDFYPDLKSPKALRQEFAINVLQVLFKKSGREMILLKKLSGYFKEAFLNMRKSLVRIISEVFYDSGRELEAVMYLLKFFEHPSKHVRGIASELIGVIIREGHKEQESVNLFESYLRSDNKYTRRAALRAIGHTYKETANKDARRLLKPFLNDPDPGVRSTVAKVIHMIFKNTNNDVLIRVTIEPLLKDPVWYVRSTVKKILSELQ